jgi:non-heme chloroperoxidase
MPEIDVNGTRLAYVEEGEGIPLIFVHGSISDYRSWGPQVPFFARYYHVIAYSRRYHYPHPWTGDGPEFAAALHADDLAGLIERLRLGPAHLVGSSYGALTSLTCAVRHPEFVRSLVLGEPPILPWLNNVPNGKPVLDAFMKDAWRPAARAFEGGNLVEGVRSFVNGISGAPVFDQIPEAVRTVQLDNATSLKAESQARPEAYFSTLTCEDVGKVDAPTLLLRGERSPLMFGLVLDELARCLPGATRATIPNASHSMASGNPDAFNETVLGFLRGLGE